MRRWLGAIVRLARCREYLCSVVVTTLLGASAGQGSLGWLLIVVLVANWLAVAFAFMINDVEDAPDDALNPAKADRNPVSAGDLSVHSGRAASFAVAILSAALYMLLGLWPSVMGMASLVIGFLYSWRRVRLKTIPIADLISHGMMLAGLQFLAAYFTFAPRLAGGWASPFAFVVVISMYGQLFNELRDLDGDRMAGLTHTASLCGPRAAHCLMASFLLAGIGFGFVTVFVGRLIPVRVFVTSAILAMVLLAPRLVRARDSLPTARVQTLFHGSLEMAAALALTIWVVGPWVESIPFLRALWTAL